MPDGWKVVDGALTRVSQAGDIVSAGEFENFELTLEWKIAKGANSGIFYRLDESAAEPEMWTAAPEYQVIDDAGYPAPLKPTQKTAANYDLQPPGRDATKPAGEWNTTRIVANGSHVEHWLNGQLIVQYELWTDEWKKLVAQSKFKDHPRYAMARRGRIGIQDHGDWAAYRNIRIRELPSAQSASQVNNDGWVALFNGKDLDRLEELRRGEVDRRERRDSRRGGDEGIRLPRHRGDLQGLRDAREVQGRGHRQQRHLLSLQHQRHGDHRRPGGGRSAAEHAHRRPLRDRRTAAGWCGRTPKARRR